MLFDDTSSDSDIKHVLLPSSCFSKMNKLNAMRKQIRRIVVLEERPFSFIDLENFEVNGTRFELKHGTIRNYLSKLTKSGEIEFAYNSGVAFYTLPGKKFTKDVTADHMGVPAPLPPYSFINFLSKVHLFTDGLRIVASTNRLCMTSALLSKLKEYGYCFV